MKIGIAGLFEVEEIAFGDDRALLLGALVTEESLLLGLNVYADDDKDLLLDLVPETAGSNEWTDDEVALLLDLDVNTDDNGLAVALDMTRSEPEVDKFLDKMNTEIGFYEDENDLEEAVFEEHETRIDDEIPSQLCANNATKVTNTNLRNIIANK